MKKKTRRAMTLIEVMIVILLIGLVGGALAYNMKGGLTEGRRFKTEQGKERIRDILLFELARGTANANTIARNWQNYVKDSPLGSDKLIKDGWNKEFIVRVDGDDFKVTSTHDTN